MLKAAFSSPKLKALQKLLQCRISQAVGHLELLWRFTAEHAPHGNVGRWSDLEIASECDWEGDPSHFVRALVDSRWLDENDYHRLVVHDWSDHCPRWVKAVVTKSGKPFAGDGHCSGDYSGDYSGDCSADISPDSQTVEPTTEGTVEPTHILSSPIISSPPHPPTPQSKNGGVGWGEIRSMLRDRNVLKPDTRPDDASVSPDDVKRLIAVWDKHHARMDCKEPRAVLVEVIRKFRAGDDPAAGWPPRRR